MKPWVLFAFASMLFAGVTSVIAKQGLRDISGELGLAVRTVFVFVLVLALTMLALAAEGFRGLDRRNVAWLAASALTTALSWLFYYKALREGEVSTIALIDKGSFVVAFLLAWIVLGEPVTLRTLLGALLIVAGLAVTALR